MVHQGLMWFIRGLSEETFGEMSSYIQRHTSAWGVNYTRLQIIDRSVDTLTTQSSNTTKQEAVEYPGR